MHQTRYTSKIKPIIQTVFFLNTTYRILIIIIVSKR